METGYYHQPVQEKGLYQHRKLQRLGISQTQLPNCHSIDEISQRGDYNLLSQLCQSMDGGAPSGPSKRKAKREWNMTELKKLISAKKHEHEPIESGANSQAKMISFKSKWEKIAQFLLCEGVLDPIRDGDSCKKRWASLSRDFRRVYDFEKQVPPGGVSYYKMTTSERRAKGVVSNFPEELYREFDDWFPKRQDAQSDALGLTIMDSSGHNCSFDGTRRKDFSNEQWEGCKRDDRQLKGGDHVRETADIASLEGVHISNAVHDTQDQQDHMRSPNIGELIVVGLGDNSAQMEDHSSAVTPPPTQKHMKKRIREKGSNGKRRKCSAISKAEAATTMYEAAAKLVDVIKDESVRRNRHTESFMEWEKQHNEQQLVLLREQTAIQREQMENRNRVETLHAQSFNVLAQALAKLVERIGSNK